MAPIDHVDPQPQIALQHLNDTLKLRYKTTANLLHEDIFPQAARPPCYLVPPERPELHQF